MFIMSQNVALVCSSVTNTLCNAFPICTLQEFFSGIKSAMDDISMTDAIPPQLSYLR